MAETTLPVPNEAPLATSAPPNNSVSGADDWRSMLPGPLREFSRQPAIARALPALAGLGALGLVGALYLALAEGPQRILYSSLSDGERAKVVETLESGGISYAIDNATGALSVAEDDVYRARMLVASDAGIAAPQGATEMLDSIPLGSSRTLEGERLRLARERELMLTIREIDGIEAVRVHLATPERSVFVRESSPPSASVMLRLVSGRSLSQSQVEAIVNLVSASVPGMSADGVRVVDQNGRLLSSQREETIDALALQREFEAKLRQQVDGLLLPLLGDGNFTSQVQVELDKAEVTSARETFEKDGSVRSESERNAVRTGQGGIGGVPGVTANTPPPDPVLVDAPPEPTAPAAGTAPTDTESAVQRSYELGREVAVTNTRPGGLVKLSVAVAVSKDALAAASPLTAEQIEKLVGAAVGADTERGDQIEVVASAFGATEMEPPLFYEQPWFAMVLRYVTALLAVLLVLLLAVRPLIARMRGRDLREVETGQTPSLPAAIGQDDEQSEISSELKNGRSLGDLPRQVELARRLAASQPERAVEALQRMLEAPEPRRDEEAVR
ncbi:flagellar M-ring protein FliF [Erythrobacter litoralis]|uniref:Flagellar M-ring protein n=1 Tax=Erythrobacter litoralis TaxID=39960 RepID=A0A074M822_9SPHN|nr:flagellar basal-body MS-ring/collar protein FliF [Erythrobacter litoralis]AOL22275.1 flagellar M-ring protein FliF [Erythrobacter litoralis]KEO89564.1 hypothetical protein EH32_03415 [Erythrobacter litoralis]